MTLWHATFRGIPVLHGGILCSVPTWPVRCFSIGSQSSAVIGERHVMWRAIFWRKVGDAIDLLLPLLSVACCFFFCHIDLLCTFPVLYVVSVNIKAIQIHVYCDVTKVVRHKRFAQNLRFTVYRRDISYVEGWFCFVSASH